MIEIILEKTDSTQNFLKEEIGKLKSNNSEVFVCAKTQNQGRGRGKNKWIFTENSLACSFTLKPFEKITLTSLEVGILICDFFKEAYEKEIFLKWPNDLINSSGEKVGGILFNFSDGVLIAGPGINLENSPMLAEREAFPPGKVFEKSDKIINYEFGKSLFSYILEHRILKSSEIIHRWNEKCFHINKNVQIVDNSKKYTGLFRGINEDGGAILSCDDQSELVFNGSLFLIP